MLYLGQALVVKAFLKLICFCIAISGRDNYIIKKQLPLGKPLFYF